MLCNPHREKGRRVKALKPQLRKGLRVLCVLSSWSLQEWIFLSESQAKKSILYSYGNSPRSPDSRDLSFHLYVSPLALPFSFLLFHPPLLTFLFNVERACCPFMLSLLVLCQKCTLAYVLEHTQKHTLLHLFETVRAQSPSTQVPHYTHTQ